MNTKEILSIVALAVLGLCLLCSLAKSAMKKGDKGKKHCDKACGAFVFLAIALLAVSQLLGEENEKYCPNNPDGTEGGTCQSLGAHCGMKPGDVDRCRVDGDCNMGCDCFNASGHHCGGKN